MCNFVSWIEYEGNIYYLQGSDLITKEGKKLLKYIGNYDDVKGHGAIDKYYGLNGKGIHKECEDFSTPDNFPKEIQEKLKNGEMADIGIAFDILTPKAYQEYKNIRDKAYQEYEKIIDKVFKNYEKIRDKAFQEYKNIKAKKYRELVKQKENRVKAWE